MGVDYADNSPSLNFSLVVAIVLGKGALRDLGDHYR